MKIFTVDEIREADKQTIEKEPISSLELMERASKRVADWILKKYSKKYKVVVLAGTGNNGGDGLAVARLLHGFGYSASLYLPMGTAGSDDFNANYERLNGHNIPQLTENVQLENFARNTKHVIWIDALFGSGLSRPIEGTIAETIEYINALQGEKIAIDIPSGLFADKSSGSNTNFKAHYTLSFQFPKLAFMFPENEQTVGTWQILDIGLNSNYIQKTPTTYHYTESVKIPPAAKFAHKGKRGRCTIIAGKYGGMGAAILASKAALHSGAGLISVQSCKKTVAVIQQAIPEALVYNDEHEQYLGDYMTYKNQDVLVVGPALGFADETKKLFEKIIINFKGKLVLDADAISYLAAKPDLLQKLPAGTILTPHIGEFDRLFGDHDNQFDRLKTQRTVAVKYQLLIVLKGKYTSVADVKGNIYFNATGNSGMAKGGSGDVLAGLLGGMLAQNTDALETTIKAVFLHGLAGDLASVNYGEFYLTPSILIANLHLAQKMLMIIQ